MEERICWNCGWYAEGRCSNPNEPGSVHKDMKGCKYFIVEKDWEKWKVIRKETWRQFIAEREKRK